MRKIYMQSEKVDKKIYAVNEIKMLYCGSLIMPVVV